MILDTSAILAVFLQEPGYEQIFDALAGPEAIGVGAPTLAEAGVVLEGRFGEAAAGWLRQFVDEFDAAVIPFGTHHWHEAVSAYARFGRGRHEAGLNFGDCLTYAVARLSGQRLLCVGSDFARTDLELAGDDTR